jgi:hypothetical protein
MSSSDSPIDIVHADIFMLARDVMRLVEKITGHVMADKKDMSKAREWQKALLQYVEDLKENADETEDAESDEDDASEDVDDASNGERANKRKIDVALVKSKPGKK